MMSKSRNLIDEYYEKKEWNTDRIPVCGDGGATFFRLIIAAVLWFMAIYTGGKAVALCLALM